MTISREIRVFISSTFDDLVAERELLTKSVWLRLPQKCRRRGVELVFIDLRWGISAERKLAEVIDLCLTAVADCYPYFIAILGERYGRIYDFQSPNYAEKYADLQAKYTWLTDHNPRSSVTELEILQALALAEQHRTANSIPEFMRYYFRDSASSQPAAQFPDDSPESQERLADLKQRIRASGLPVRTYQQPDELVNWILRDLWHYINRRFPLNRRLTPQQQEALEHEYFARSRQQVYIERPADLQRLDAQAASDEPPLIILGESGIGKSALLANWALSYRQRHPQDVVIFHFIGSSPYSTEEAVLLRRIMTELQTHFTMTEPLPTDPQQLSDRLPFWFAAAHAQAEQQGRRIILILDGLNQLAETAQQLNWLPRFIPKRIRLLVATLPGMSLTALESRAWSTLTVAPLTELEREDLIRRYLHRYHKELSPHHVQQLVVAPLTANPLYLRVLLEELRLFGKFKELEQQLNNYLAADSVVALYQKVLTRLAADYERERPQLVRDALTVLWAARRGLTETEWLTMLSSAQPLPQNQWLPFFLAVREALINRNSLWGFAHDYFRQAVQQSYLPTVTDQQSVHRRLASYFSQQPLDSRQADELPYHWFHANENNQLQTCISEISMFHQLMQDDKKYELWKYWRYLGTSANMVACYKTTLAEYEKTVSTPIELADLLNQLAGFFNTTGNFSAAEPLYRRALAILEQELGANHPATASSLNNLAILLDQTIQART
ncbi:MAG: DUF4062 domain-containing protein, partial [Thioploca sp.]|nr:DUF4062 domain-containing protein [Thioploca sp.]